MLVMILKKVPESLRGALSRWLLEPETGVFLGSPSARVRDELWELATSKARRGMVLQIWNHPGPQGFKFRHYNPSGREMVDFEGLTLVRRLEKSATIRVAVGTQMAAFTKSDVDRKTDENDDEKLITE